MIDIRDFAVGLSKTVVWFDNARERPGHPCKRCGIFRSSWCCSHLIFPVAVWSWNFAIATVCGNATIWKPSPKTPLVSYACEAIFKKAVERSGIPQAQNILELVIGANEHAEWLADDKHVNPVSLTGSNSNGTSTW